MVDVAIVGGGLAGLAAAWYAQQRGLSYVLLECEGRLGGKAQSEQVWGYGDTPFTVEYGPDGFITRKPWALELARDVGAETTPIRDLPERIYVLRGGKLHAIPDGLYLLVPTKPIPFMQSSLFSPWGKLRMLAEPLVPRRQSTNDESVAAFIKRRLGTEALERLGEPMLAGVYNADAERMSMGATFKQFPALEREYGSLVRGMTAKMRAKQQKPDTPALVSMLNGMEDLAAAVAGKLTGDVHTNTRVEAISRSGDAYTLHHTGGTTHAEALVITTPATATAKLLESVSAGAAQQLGVLRYEGVGSMALAYRAEDVPHPMDAYGVVVPGVEGRRIDGITFASSKWANRAPEGYHLLRVFFGGPNTRDMLDLPDDALLAEVRRELHAILGIEAEPLFHRVGRWHAGYPQYDVGHQQRVQAMRDALPGNIFIAGLSYDGVGIPDTVHGARRAIQNITVTETNEVEMQL